MDRLKNFLDKHSIKSIQDMQKVLKSGYSLSSNDKKVLNRLRLDKIYYRDLFSILKIEDTSSNKVLLVNILSNKINDIQVQEASVTSHPVEEKPALTSKHNVPKLADFFTVEKAIIEVKYNTLSLEDVVFYFKGAISAYHSKANFNISHDSDTPMSLTSMSFFSLSKTFELNSFFKIKLANMAYRLIIAHLLNYSNLQLKADPYYTIKNVVSLLQKPLCTYEEFQSLFSPSTKSSTLKNDLLYKKVTSIIKDINKDLKHSIIKLTFKRTNKQIWDLFYGILNIYSPHDLKFYDKDYHYILYLLKNYNPKGDSFVILCDNFQRKQIESYLEEVNYCFLLIAMVNTYVPYRIDCGAFLHNYTSCIINKSFDDLFDKKKKISNHTFSTLIRALDLCIPLLQSFIINDVLPALLEIENK